MSSYVLTPSEAIDKNKEKDWAANLGMMDWDSTRIVFTKRSLIEFLKSIDITVDPHFSNIQKLPRYAEFKKIVENGVTATPADEEASPGRATVKSSLSGRIFATGEDDDALAGAPPRADESVSAAPPVSPEQSQPAEPEEVGLAFPSQKPSRRVRTAPGGQDNIAGLWGDSGVQDEFKPTRKVRQRPGGQDHISSIF